MQAKQALECSVTGCGRQALYKGLCSPHYQRLQKRGAVFEDQPIRAPRPERCAESGCESPVHARGHCQLHYRRRLNRGELAEKPRLSCSVDGCEVVAFSLGFCNSHYQRQYKTGDTRAELPLKVVGDGSITKDGYRVITKHGHPNSTPRGRILEHRWIAAEHLGRALVDEENVHHRNGHRLENTIGPCLVSNRCECPGELHNLELWSKSQPKGQRVADKLAWARAFIQRYAPESD